MGASNTQLSLARVAHVLPREKVTTYLPKDYLGRLAKWVIIPSEFSCWQWRPWSFTAKDSPVWSSYPFKRQFLANITLRTIPFKLIFSLRAAKDL